MIDDVDDTLAGYVPGKARGAPRMRIEAGDNGIVASISLNGHQEPREPTRYALALRRQASNRARAKAGQEALPAIPAGSCERCEGWGVLGRSRQRCSDCGGSGG